jgi:hypothetical protein
LEEIIISEGLGARCWRRFVEWRTDQPSLDQHGIGAGRAGECGWDHFYEDEMGIGKFDFENGAS